jgi:fructokinase
LVIFVRITLVILLKQERETFIKDAANSTPAGPGVICMGEALVDIQPAERRQTLQAANLLRRVAGGAPANVTVALARLGVPAAFLGKVGADPFGYFLRDTLAGAGVDISRMRFGTEAATGVAFAWVKDVQTGEVGYFSLRYLSADRTLAPEELDLNWLRRATAFQFGSLLLSAEPSATATWQALETVRAAGVPCLYDLNLRLPAWKSPEQARKGMLAPLECSDIVKLNRHELAFLTGETDLERGVAKIWRPDCWLLVVTLDREGCYYRTRTGSGRLDGFPVAVADTIACGDAFVAGLLAQLLRLSYTGINKTAAGIRDFDYANPEQVRRACYYANGAGALTATRPGAIPALPTRRQLDRFLKSATANLES